MERPGPSRRAVVSSILALATVAGRPRAIASSDELRFGLTPVFLTTDLELLARLRSYLEQATGVRSGSSRGAPTRKSRRSWSRGSSTRPGSAAFPSWPTARSWRSLLSRSGAAGHSTDPTSSPAGTGRRTGSDDLKGDMHAFSDPDSNSGWLVTATALARRGQTPSASSRRRSSPGATATSSAPSRPGSPTAAASTATSTRSCARLSRT